MDVVAERVGSGAGDDGRTFTQTRRGHGDVGWTAAQELLEVTDVDDAAVAGGVKVDADPPDREDVEGRDRVGHGRAPRGRTSVVFHPGVICPDNNTSGTFAV